MNNQNEVLVELQEEHMTELIRLAFKYEDYLIAKRLTDEEEHCLTGEDIRFSSQIIDTAWRKIEQHKKIQRKKEVHRRIRHIMPRVVLIAVCLLLLLNLAIPIAVASNAYLRSKVVQLLISIDDQRGSIDLVFIEDENASFEVPTEWEGIYFPMYIPAGFSVSNFDSWKGQYCEITYESSNGAIISFEEVGYGAGGTVGIEGGMISYEDVNGHSAMICQTTDGRYIEINWSTDDRWLVVKTDGLGYEESLQIAESVRIIIK